MCQPMISFIFRGKKKLMRENSE